MHGNQQLWLAWGRGELSDDEAHERMVAQARQAARPTKQPIKQPREKVFGFGRPVPLDRNAKVRVMVYARALMRRTEAGKHYGKLTAKAVAVLEALLWGFHNAATGRCFPSYERIAERAACSRAMVYEAIRMLERAGILSWVNRLVRMRERVEGLFGPKSAWRWRVVRTSNAYAFADPASKSRFQPGTTNQVEPRKKICGQVTEEAAADGAISASSNGCHGPGR